MFYKMNDIIFFNIESYNQYLSELGIYHKDWPDYYNQYQLSLSDEIKIRIARSKGQLKNETRK